jgi:lipoprotein-releasing system permease protein
MYKYFLALKYLIARRITLASLLVTTLGVMVMLIVVSVITGYKIKVEEVLRGNTADLIIGDIHGRPIEEYEDKLREISSVKGVEAAAPYIEQGVLVAYGNKEYKWCMLKGIDPAYEMKIGKFREYVEGSLNVAKEFKTTHGGEPPVILGKSLLTVAGVEAGQSVDITAPQISENENAPLRTMSFHIIGFTRSGRYDIDNMECYVPLTVAQEMLGLKRGKQVTHIKVQVKNQRNLTDVKFAVAEALAVADFTDGGGASGTKFLRQGRDLDEKKDVFGDYYIFTWRDEKRNELYAVDKDRNILIFLVAFIIIGAGFVTLAILVMMVFEKRKDIGILKAVGCPWYGTVAVFLLMGLLIGAAGSLLGWGAGALAIDNINEIAKVVEKISGKRVFAAEVYGFDKIPAYTDPLAVLIILSATIGVSLVSSVAAAIRAATVDPVQTLRYE